jgi:WD40 repeat protein
VVCFKEHTTQLAAVCVAPDGKHVVTGSRENILRMWEVETGKVVRNYADHPHGGSWFVSFTRDGKRFLSSGPDGCVRVWDAVTAEPLAVFGGHRAGATSVLGLADSRRAVSTSADKTVRLWALP